MVYFHTGFMHTVAPIKQVTAGMRKQLNMLTEGVYKKMKRCRNIEKSAWRRLSDYEEYVETIHDQLDESIEQLVTMIPGHSIGQLSLPMNDQ